MTIGTEADLERLRRVGRVTAEVMAAMAGALEPGMTTGELDRLGRSLLEREGARSALAVTYGFPGATCISVFPAIAHGIPGARRVQAGDLVNIRWAVDTDDGWTLEAEGARQTVQYEHTLVATERGPIVVTLLGAAAALQH